MCVCVCNEKSGVSLAGLHAWGREGPAGAKQDLAPLASDLNSRRPSMEPGRGSRPGVTVPWSSMRESSACEEGAIVLVDGRRPWNWGAVAERGGLEKGGRRAWDTVALWGRAESHNVGVEARRLLPRHDRLSELDGRWLVQSGDLERNRPGQRSKIMSLFWRMTKFRDLFVR